MRNADENFSQMVRAIVRDELARARAESSPIRIPQQQSPLGRRRHIRCVRRRIADGLGGAWVIGRSYFLSDTAIEEELDQLGHRSAPSSSDVEAASAELDKRLGIEVIRED